MAGNIYAYDNYYNSGCDADGCAGRKENKEDTEGYDR